MVPTPYALDHPSAAALRDALMDQDDALADTEGLLARVIEQLDHLIATGFDWRAHTLRMDVDRSRHGLAMLRHRLLPIVDGGQS
jgi:hypothetical protein